MVKSMKVLKKAAQKNILLNKDYYTLGQINKMLETKECFYFTPFDYEECYDFLHYYELEEISIRIFLECIEEIKVVYNKRFGNYETVAIGKNGKTYHVEL